MPLFVGVGYGLVLIGDLLSAEDEARSFGGELAVALGCCYGYVIAPVGALIGVCGLLQTSRRRWPVLLGIAINMAIVAILYLGVLNPLAGFNWMLGRK